MRAELDLPDGASVYPGHPLTIAYLITKAHSCFEEAAAPTCHGFARALGNNEVPGAGGNVHHGLEVLRKLHKGWDLPKAAEWAKQIWARTDRQDHVVQGQEQADKVLPLLATNPTWWQPRPNGAILDETRKYRYRLWRDCGEGVGTCAFIMLNPSTADENENDPTIRKCMKYARTWGYARLVVVNLFAFRATEPKELEKIKDREKAVGRDNDAFIDEIFTGEDWKADMVIAAWGGHGKHLDRDWAVLNRVKQAKLPLHYLKLATTVRKSPYHPLYLKDDLKPQLLE